MDKMFAKAMTSLVALFCVASASAAIACCSLAPAEFTRTCGWVGEFHRNGKTEHLLAYANIAKNNNRGTVGPDGKLYTGNAMILPIPAVPGTMSEKSLLDGHAFQTLVEDVYTSTRSYADDPLAELYEGVEDQLNGLNGYKGSEDPPPVVLVFTKGSYTVVMSNSAKAIPGALAQVPQNKRPAVNKELFAAYDKWYPGWTYALCCFDNATTNVEPMVWIYEPKNPDQLFFPAVDEHSGGLPKLDTMVDVDHRLAVTSDRIWSGLANNHTVSSVQSVVLKGGIGKEAADFIPSYGMGGHFTHEKLNGDFTFNVNEVRAGIFRPLRTPPPGSDTNPIFPIAEALLDKTLYAKVVTGLLLASIVLLFFRRWKQSFVFLVIGLGLTALLFKGVIGIYYPASPQDLVKAAIYVAAFYIMGVLLPLWQIGRHKFSSRPFVGLVLLVLAGGFLMPQSSGNWIPLAFAILVGAAVRKAPLSRG